MFLWQIAQFESWQFLTWLPSKWSNPKSSKSGLEKSLSYVAVDSTWPFFITRNGSAKSRPNRGYGRWLLNDSYL